MIARLIRQVQGVNPAAKIDDNPATVVLPDGTYPDASMPPLMEFPVGTTLEHPLAWMHCVYGTHNAPPVAEPADDECRRIVAKHLQKRESDIMAIREKSLELDGRGQAGKFMQNLARSYGVDE
jgi:hypothetical protein